MAKPEARWGSLPFAEQIAFFKDKVDLPTERWQDLLGSAHDRAFVVAGAMKADLLADLHAAVLKAIEQGTTLETFRKDFKAIVAKRGWTGWTGEDTPEGVAWRTKTIYGTNLRTSYQAGRHAQAQAIAHRRPFWRYVHNATVMDPRPEHLAWHGKILRADDPWWQAHWPPSGWGCRCRVETLSQRDMDRLGKSGPDTPPDDGTYEWLDKRTGKTHTIPKGIDPGWDYTPGATRDLIAEVKAKAAGLPTQLGEALYKDVSSIKALETSANGATIDSKRGGIQQASTTGEKPMTATIYQDERRTLTVDDGILTATPVKGPIGTLVLDNARISGIDTKTAAAIKASGQDPTDWYSLKSGMKTMALPPATRAVVEDAIAIRAAAIAAKKQAAVAAEEAFSATLEGQRAKLVRDEYNSYSPEHFPGSPQWIKHQKAEKALQAFDAAHPEIVEKIKKTQKSAEKAKYDAMSDFDKWGG